jgi:hypothetical protein
MLGPMSLARILFLCLTAVPVSCGQTLTEGGLGSPVPAARINAIDATSRVNDRSAIPQIVEALTSDDAAVRFTAIAALQRMTGETFGYRAEASTADRQKSVKLWVNAVKSDTVPHAPAGGAHG